MPTFPRAIARLRSKTSMPHSEGSEPPWWPPILRGCVYPEAPRRIGPVAEALLGFAEVRTLSFEDLFAGKIVAALDRQHPRDLYDAKLLLEREGLTRPLMTAFLVYLVSGDNRMSRTLQPVRKPLDELYVRQSNGSSGTSA